MRILIVDSLRESYQSLKAVLQVEEDITVVGFAPTVDEALYEVHYCDLVLISESLVEVDSVRLVRQLLDACPRVKVLVTGLSEEAGRILEFVEAGASGYILKQESRAALLQKIRAASRDRAVVSPQMAASLMAHLAALSLRVKMPAHATTSFSFGELTPREREILDLLADGLSNRQIANRLHIQVGTVKNHVHHILNKLEASDRYEAATAYRRWLQQDESREAYVFL